MRRRDALAAGASLSVLLGTGLTVDRTTATQEEGTDTWRSYGGDTRSSGYRPDGTVPTDGAEASVSEAVAAESQRLDSETDEWGGWARDYSAIAADAEHVYYAGSLDHDAVEGALVAVDRASGEKAWQFAPNDAAQWLRGGVTVRGETAVVGGMADGSESGILFGVDTTNGTERWRTRVPGAVWMPPEWHDDTLYVASRYVQFTGAETALLALDPTDGTIRWTIPGPELPDRYLQTSPIVDDSGLYIAANWETIARYDHDGTRQWTTTIGGPILAPATADDRTIYATRRPTREGRVDIVALDKASGRTRWRTRVESDGPDFRPAVSENAVFVSTLDGDVFCLSKDGDVRWETEIVGTGMTPPTVVDGLVFLGVFEQLDSGVVALRADNGRQLYTYPTDQPPAGEILAVDGGLWVLESNNRLHRLEPGETSDTTPTPSVEIASVESTYPVNETIELDSEIPEEVDVETVAWEVTRPDGWTSDSTGESRPLSLSETGEWTVELWVENGHGNWGGAQETIVVREPTPTPSPTPTESPTPSTATPTAGRADTATEMPGLGVVSTLLGAGGAAYLLGRNRDGTRAETENGDRGGDGAD